MKRFKNILFYMDGQTVYQSALNRAVDLANRNQGRLTVVNVMEELPRELSRFAAGMPLEDLQSMAMQAARERLEPLVAPLQEKGPPMEMEVLYGEPFIEVIRAVLRRRHDLVLMTAEGRNGLKQSLFGSTSLHLIRKCPCPVWVIKAAQTQRFARILAAVDPDPSDVVRDGVNIKVMELATSLTAVEESELHIVHAWQACEPMVWRGWQARVPQAQLDDWVRQTREAHQQRLVDLLGRFNHEGQPHRLHLVEGEAGPAIAQLAGQEQIDLIVMGTVARAGLEGYFIGNTAETVLQHASCSVLAVEPEGFVSPVRLN
jgi:universal stress protein E